MSPMRILTSRTRACAAASLSLTLIALSPGPRAWATVARVAVTPSMAPGTLGAAGAALGAGGTSSVSSGPAFRPGLSGVLGALTPAPGAASPRTGPAAAGAKTQHAAPSTVRTAPVGVSPAAIAPAQNARAVPALGRAPALAGKTAGAAPSMTPAARSGEAANPASRRRSLMSALSERLPAFSRMAGASLHAEAYRDFMRRIGGDGRLTAGGPAASARKAAAKTPSAGNAKENQDERRIDLLAAGQRAYAEEPENLALDENTLNDLEVFHKEYGLFTLFPEVRTALGRKRLAWLLKHPYLDAAEIRRRQAAVRELMTNDALRAEVREAFDDLGKSADAGLTKHFFQDKGDSFPFIMANLLNLIMAGLVFMLVPSMAAGGFAWRSLAQPLMIWLWLFFPMYRTIKAVRNNFLRYKAAFKLARRLHRPLGRSGSRALAEIGGVFSSVEDKEHALKLRPFARSAFRTWSPGASFLLDFIYVHSGKTLWRLNSKFKRARASIAHVLGALGELDVYQALAEKALATEGWSAFPKILDDKTPSLRISDGHHPLLASKGTSVANGIGMGIPRDAEGRIDAETRDNLLVLTGANMGGKSTYLKMVSVLTLLAQIGAPVPAAAMELTPLELLTSIEIRHSLYEGKSLYDAETDRILEIIRKAEGSGRMLGVIDEILQGTNPDDRIAIERAIARYLAGTGNLFLIATHNLKITGLEGEVPGVRNIHVEERFQDGKMKFSYKVTPGPATSRNAIPALEMKGFPEEVIGEAKRQAKD